MAKVTVKAMDIELDGTDYSSEISSANLQISVDTNDSINMESEGWQEMVGSIIRATLNLTFKKDADLSGLDSALWAKLGEAMTFACLLDGDNAIAPGNPEFQGSVVVNSHEFGGAVGSLHEHSVSWPVTGKVIRDTTP